MSELSQIVRSVNEHGVPVHTLRAKLSCGHVTDVSLFGDVDVEVRMKGLCGMNCTACSEVDRLVWLRRQGMSRMSDERILEYARKVAREQNTVTEDGKPWDREKAS